MFDTETVSLWRCMLHDDDWQVRQEALKVLELAISYGMLSLYASVSAHGGTGDLRQQVFDTETVSVLCSMLHDDDWAVRQEVLKVLGLAIYHSMLSLWASVCAYSETGDLRHQVFDNEIVSVWRSMLYDDDCDVRQEALKVLGLVISYSMLHLCASVCAHSGTGDLRQQMFDTETISTWRSMLQDDDWIVRQEALNVLCCAIHQSMLPLCVSVGAHGGTGDLRQQLFDAETVSVWHSMLHDDNCHVRQEARNVSGLAIYHSSSPPFYFSIWTHSEPGDLRPQMFDTETVSVWHNMLHDDDCDVRQEALKILGVAISHGMLSLLC